MKTAVQFTIRLHCLAMSLLLALSPVTAQTSRLTGRVTDSLSGTPIPCRLLIERLDGTTFFASSADPAGSAVIYDRARSPQSVERHTTLSAHPFTADLPPGRYRLRAEHGKEYHPSTATVDIGDAPVHVDLKLTRWTNMASLGWFSGDTHVHRTLADLPNVMLAEDLNVALPLSYWVREGRLPPRLENANEVVKPELIHVDDRHVIWPMNTEYEIFTMDRKQHTLGAVFVLNHQSPLQPGAPPVGPIAAEARAQGAILDLDKHSWPWSLMLIPVMNVDLFELSNNHVWQTNFYFNKWTTGVQPSGWNIETDDNGWTEWGWIDFGFKTYYALLNSGFRLRPTAGTASGVHPVPLGFGRVYVHLPSGFNYQDWIAGLYSGRSFVTTGPMLTCTFNGRPHGETFSSNTPLKLTINGEAFGSRPLHSIEIVRNGEVVESIRPENNRTDENAFLTRFAVNLEIDASSWIAVRCFESDPERRNRFAHTSPVHIDIAGKPLLPKKKEVDYFVQRMEQELERNKDNHTPDELAEYQHALQIYKKLQAAAVE